MKYPVTKQNFIVPSESKPSIDRSIDRSSFSAVIMDIKTLLDNLHDEVSCSVCMSTFTEPKQLPCLHSFCLHCLSKLQRTSGLRAKIACPECREQFRIPGSGNPSKLPTNFRINSLYLCLVVADRAASFLREKK